MESIPENKGGIMKNKHQYFQKTAFITAILLTAIFFITFCSKKQQPSAADSSPLQKDTGTRIIIDHDGEEVTVPNQINRVVTVSVWPLPSVVTIFCGGPQKLAGIPPASKSAAKSGILGELYPELLSLPSDYTNGSDINIEEILKLNPDVVLCSSKDAKTKQMLKEAGLPAIGFSVNNWNYNIITTYSKWIELLSQIFPEYAKTDKVSEYSEKVYEEVNAKVKDIPQEQKKKALFLFNYNEKTIVTSGRNFFGQFWCDATGTKNVAEEVAAEMTNATISMEQIYDWNPDIIFITNFTTAVPETLFNNETGIYDWSPVKAVQDKQVYKMPLGTYRSYTPSTDTPCTLLWMAQKAYPELFTDMDLTQRVKEYYNEMYSISLTEEQIERMYNQTGSSAEGTKLN